MNIFDARTVYGTPFMKPPVSDDLSGHLSACETKRAIVIMEEQLYLPPDDSLAIAKRRISACPGAYGLAVMAAACTGEVPAAEELASAFKKDRFAGFLLCPGELRIPSKPIFFADELSAAARLQIPVFYHAAGKDNTLDFAVDVLTAFPNLRMVLSCGDEWPNTRKLYPLLRAFPELRVCLSEFVWMGGMEDFCSRFGSERMLYSSSYPKRYPGGSMLMIANADISDTDKENIACRNLERLIGGMLCD